MQSVLDFLHNIAINNNREWFMAHREEYDAAQETFRQAASQMIATIAAFDTEVAHVDVKSTLYRFYRDTRFSLDKSPYKRHFGSYINARGKKSPHGGYYLHIQPGNCLLAVGSYCLPSPILRAVRQSIVDRVEEYRAIVEDPAFHTLCPVIGESHLKTTPAGFPRDFAHPEYLRPKDYSTYTYLPDEFFLQRGWVKNAAGIFQTMKPFLDFVNDTIDDYI